MNKADAWIIYYASIVAIKLHPRNDTDVDLEELAELADKMLDITNARMRKPPCQSQE